MGSWLGSRADSLRSHGIDFDTLPISKAAIAISTHQVPAKKDANNPSFSPKLIRDPLDNNPLSYQAAPSLSQSPVAASAKPHTLPSRLQRYAFWAIKNPRFILASIALGISAYCLVNKIKQQPARKLSTVC